MSHTGQDETPAPVDVQALIEIAEVAEQQHDEGLVKCEDDIQAANDAFKSTRVGSREEGKLGVRLHELRKARSELIRNVDARRADLRRALKTSPRIEDVDGLLLAGLSVSRYSVKAAREWVVAARETQQTLEEPGLLFFKVHNRIWQLPTEFSLGITSGEPIQVKNHGDDDVYLQIPIARMSQVTREGSKTIYEWGESDRSVQVWAKWLNNPQYSEFLIGEEPITKAFDSATNIWGINGSDELHGNSLLLLWAAARGIGRPDLLPQQVNSFVPQWKETYLREATRSLVADVAEMPTAAKYRVDFMRALAPIFDYGEDDILQVRRTAERFMGQIMLRGTEAEVDLDSLPALLVDRLNIMMSRVETAT